MNTPTTVRRPARRRGGRVLAAAATLGLALPIALAGPAAAATSVPGADPFAAPGDYAEQNLGADRTEADFFYRIPALAHLGDGVVLASWDARPGSAADAPNANSIVQRRSTDNGRTWGPMTTVAAGHAGDADTPKHGYSDPSYVVDEETGTVFSFFVYSKDQGFHGSEWGNDDADRDVISAAVVESGDGGRTWSEPRLITDVAKPGADKTADPGDVRSTFATSGAGIQLKYGEHAGRLVQQYAGVVKQADGSTPIQAYSVYSDDHGATWERGEFVGTGMDENKVVELSDGRVMMNSRDSGRSGFRKVAVSTDGGHSYGPVRLERQLVDPTNNAHITRMHPDAPEGSDEAAMLLYTGSNHPTSRENVTARVSCDDGETWPGARTIRHGFSAYSVATALDDGRFGVFYEGSYTDDMVFGEFGGDWLNHVCAPLGSDGLALDAGATATAQVTIENQESATLSGTLTVAGPEGWAAGTAEVDVPAGGTATVDVPVTAPATANGETGLQAVFTAADGRESQGTVSAQVAGREVIGLDIAGQRADGDRDLAADPYAAGDQVPYTFRVTHTGNVNQWVVPTEGNFEPFAAAPVGESAPAGNCRWSNLSPGDAYNCTTPRHTVTGEEHDDGFFTPGTVWTTGKVPEYTAVAETYEISGGEVDLRERAPGISASAEAGRYADTDGDGRVSAGDEVSYPLTIANDGNVRLTGLTSGGSALAGDLGIGAEAADTVVHVVTAAEARSRTVATGSVEVAARNGSLTTTTAAQLPETRLPAGNSTAWCASGTAGERGEARDCATR
ncbi:exo-alpha-sialidase [Zhihengliuella salsuginis]|uniref:exo-alpha-sialidase n=1 Tax=Zhihengliuella salsuginis TaxID=578222 RepID=A0ABQ3GH09_9MICC|nr:exo-alpha-sialidase [Zhihengliuella salsuginis]GHD04425.1 hypothetical protein GCM10008096_11740 [Zhihengliuella salsuginis]